MDERVIDSLGGIVDTLKPMEETLRQHELRPYTVQRDYRRELSKSQRGGGGNNFSGSQHSNRHVITDHMNQENVKLVSVSPFRAVVKVEDGSDDDDEGDETFEAAEPNQQLD